MNNLEDSNECFNNKIIFKNLLSSNNEREKFKLSLRKISNKSKYIIKSKHICRKDIESIEQSLLKIHNQYCIDIDKCILSINELYFKDNLTQYSIQSSFDSLIQAILNNYSNDNTINSNINKYFMCLIRNKVNDCIIESKNNINIEIKKIVDFILKFINLSFINNNENLLTNTFESNEDEYGITIIEPFDFNKDNSMLDPWLLYECFFILSLLIKHDIKVIYDIYINEIRNNDTNIINCILKLLMFYKLENIKLCIVIPLTKFIEFNEQLNNTIINNAEDILDCMYVQIFNSSECYNFIILEKYLDIVRMLTNSTFNNKRCYKVRNYDYYLIARYFL